MKAKILSLLIICLLLVSPFLFSGCFRTPSTIKYQMELEVWGVFDDSEAFAKLNQEYKRANPQIRDIRYRKISSDMVEYERELFDAIAAGKGPDVFYFHNTWLSSHANKIAPHPDSAAKLPVYKENFVDVAYGDFVGQDKIFAMPLDCDSLALYYNKDLLNQAGITQPPATWDDVVNDVKYLTKIDQNGNINQATISLGRSKNPGGINRSSDILMLLMLQGGAKMYEAESGQVSFDRSLVGNTNPGQSALDFYTHFAKGSFDAYTWNSKMDYNIDSFRYGKTAMILNYSYLHDRLKKSDPKLNFDIAPAPQLSLANQVNFANYWGLSVAKDKEYVPLSPQERNPGYTNDDRVKEAWRYIEYVTTKPLNYNPNDPNSLDPTADYLAKTKKPAARKDLVEKQKNDLVLRTFAYQALTAKSWPQPDELAVEDIFVDMIDDVVSGKASSADALRTAASRVNALIRRDISF